MNIKSKSKIHETKANIFAALDLDDAPVLHAKSGLVFHIAQILKQRKLTKAKAAAILGMDQLELIDLLGGKLEAFSTDRLFRFLTALECDIEIVVKPKARSAKSGEVRVLAA